MAVSKLSAMPVAILADGIGRGRRDHHDAGPAGRRDVLEPAAARLPGAARRQAPAPASTAAKVSGMTKRLAAAVLTTSRLRGRLSRARAPALRFVDGDAAGDSHQHGARHAPPAPCPLKPAHSGGSNSIWLSTISSKAMVRRFVLRVVMSGGVELLDAHGVLAEAVVVAVDLPRALGGDHDEQRSASRGMRQQLVDTRPIHQHPFRRSSMMAATWSAARLASSLRPRGRTRPRPPLLSAAICSRRAMASSDSVPRPRRRCASSAMVGGAMNTAIACGNALARPERRVDLQQHVVAGLLLELNLGAQRTVQVPAILYPFQELPRPPPRHRKRLRAEGRGTRGRGLRRGAARRVVAETDITTWSDAA